MKAKLSRRDFLKLGGLALGGMAFSPFIPPVTEFEDLPLVRVATTSVSVHSMPNDESRIIRQVFRDEILPVYEEVNSGTPGFNPVWYRVWGGFVHRARMPRVQFRYNAPADSIREGGQLGEITVPFTQAHWPRRTGWEPLYRLYYETVHWVIGIEEGPDGQSWYQIRDELDKRLIYNVPATHVRLIKDEEFAPITPDVPLEQKRVEVALDAQIMTCYEHDEIVFQTNISSGRVGTVTPPGGIPTRTPIGRAYVTNKMPSKHMGDGQLASDIEAYELVGVPWTVFIRYEHLPFQGHAFHGTYWHDNYGVPMSSGCINMRNHEAKWFFRWCLPKAGAEDIRHPQLDRPGAGTRIVLRI
jgi:lipoprotein-anchoring transpeptidase ErfK/SrfK